jgi:hypothetical protein
MSELPPGAAFKQGIVSLAAVADHRKEAIRLADQVGYDH